MSSCADQWNGLRESRKSIIDCLTDAAMCGIERLGLIAMIFGISVRISSYPISYEVYSFTDGFSSI